MQDCFPQLGCAFLINAAMVSLALSTHNVTTADRTLLRHMKQLAPARMLVVVNDPRDFRNHVAAALDFNPIADLHSQAFDLIHVVQSGAADGCPTDRYRLQLGHRREFPGPPDLDMNVLNLRGPGTRGVLECDCP